MLSWTGSGAVQRPRSLQIRLQRSYPGRVRAGAPVPTRAMSTAEVIENLRFFTAPSTRGQPVDTVVLSGVGAASRPDLQLICEEARKMAVIRLVLHAGVEDLEDLKHCPPVDRLVLPLQSAEAGATLSAGATALRLAQQAGVQVSANTVLTPGSLPYLPAVARIVMATRTPAITFTYPFPVDGSQATEVVPAPAAVAALREAIAMMPGVAVDIKGLPVCYLGDLRGYVRRTANRWYVDADRQLGKALLFFPDVVAFYKEDDCRFCTVDGQCDGFFATYLRRPGFAALKAVT